MSSVTLEKRECLALLKGAEQFREAAVAGDKSFEQAALLLVAYAKVLDKMLDALLDKTAQQRRSEDVIKTMLVVVKSQAAPEVLAELSQRLKNVGSSEDYRKTQGPWEHQHVVEGLRERSNQLQREWRTQNAPDVATVDAFTTVVEQVEKQLSEISRGATGNPSRSSPSPPPERKPLRPSVGGAPKSMRKSIVEDDGSEEGAALKVEEFIAAPTPTVSRLPMSVLPPAGEESSSDTPRAATARANAAAQLHPMARSEEHIVTHQDARLERAESVEFLDVVKTERASKELTNVVVSRNEPVVTSVDRSEDSPTNHAKTEPQATKRADVAVASSPPPPAAVVEPAKAASPPPSGELVRKKSNSVKKFFTLRKKDLAEAHDNDDGDMSISGPMDVVHNAHVGPNEPIDDQALQKLLNDTLGKQKGAVSPTSTIRSGPESGQKLEKRKTLFSTLRNFKLGSENGGGKDGEEVGESEPEISIGSPVDVQHEAHVNATEATPEIVENVVDNALLKERQVDVSSTLAEKIPFAEAYDPDAF